MNKMKPKTIAILVSVILFTIILYQNSDRTEIDILFWHLLEVPLFGLILFSLLLGVAIGYTLHYTQARARKKGASIRTTESTESPSPQS